VILKMNSFLRHIVTFFSKHFQICHFIGSLFYVTHFSMLNPGLKPFFWGLGFELKLKTSCP
jgi:hypothetical protein